MTIVLDCSDPEHLATFWEEALGYRKAPSAEPYVVLVDREGRNPDLILQRVPEPKAGKNRMHVDITTPNVETESSRLLALGARRLSADEIEEYGFRWIVMADPEGNEFCVCQPPPEEAPATASPPTDAAIPE